MPLEFYKKMASVLGADARVQAWRRPGQWYVWAIWWKECSLEEGQRWFGVKYVYIQRDLHVFRRPTLYGHMYITYILMEYVVDFSLFISLQFLFLQDIALPHIGNVWGYREKVGAWTCSRRSSVDKRTFQELRIILVLAWDQIHKIR